jgi:uncharacterized protein YbjT (DUF2867 family)
MIVVVGGTGRVGRQVVAQLRERNLPVRVVARGLNPAGPPAGAELDRADLTDPASLQPHLAGAQALFLVWPFTSPGMTAELAPKVARIAARHTGRGQVAVRRRW